MACQCAFPVWGSGEEIAGGNCWREGVCDTLWCGEYGEEVAAYEGETGRNSYIRGLEHLKVLESWSEDKSVLWLHSFYHHSRREDIKYSMRVTITQSTSLDRQGMEQVNISYFRASVLMNRRIGLGGVRVEKTKYMRWGTDS